MKLWLSILVLVLAGCASTGVVPMDKDTYLVSEKWPQVGFGPPVGLKAEVYQQANEFCATKGKKVETVSFESVNSGLARSGSASLQFRCVDDSPPKK